MNQSDCWRAAWQTVIGGAMLCGSSVIVFADQDDTNQYRYVSVAGEVVELSLTNLGDTPTIAANQHYQVQSTRSAEHRGRLSYIDGRWQGMLNYYGTLYAIDNVATTPAAAASTPISRAATIAEELNATTRCGAGDHAFTPPYANQTPSRSATISSAPLSFNTLEAEAVEDITLLPEVNFVFDSAFQTVAGASYQDTAQLIVDLVDFYYESFFGIRFKRINMGFGEGDVFPSSTAISDVYSDMWRLRTARTPLPFDTNTRSFLHFISGQDYYNGSDRTVGIAAFPAYTSYPNGVSTLVCSTAAIGTSQLFGSASTRALLTSLIVAHELGHNFGFDHDGQSGSFSSNCNDSASIMGADINGGEKGFSSCSLEALAANIASIRAPENCLSFPVAFDLSGTDNPEEYNPESPLYLSYTAVMSHQSHVSGSFSVAGSLAAGSEASFDSVTANGLACSISADGQSYHCDAIENQQAQIVAAITGTGADITVSTNADSATELLTAVNAAEATLTQTIAANTSIANAESPPVVTLDVPAADTTDSSNNSTDSSNNSSGGGSGGNLGMGALLFCFLLLRRRRRRP